MSKKKTDHTEERIEGFEEVLSRTEQYIEDNQKSLTVIVLAITVIIVGFTLYKRYIVAPKEKEASSQMYIAEQYFEKDSFNLALQGDGNNMGFLDIIEEYGITKSANLSNYYAGICYMHLDDYETAIQHLKKFDSDDQTIQGIATGAIGDAYLETGQQKEALNMYLKAAKRKNNQFVAPIYYMKAGALYEDMEDYKKALQTYETLQHKYPKSAEAKDIEKYIARVKLLDQEAKPEK